MVRTHDSQLTTHIRRARNELKNTLQLFAVAGMEWSGVDSSRLKVRDGLEIGSFCAADEIDRWGGDGDGRR